MNSHVLAHIYTMESEIRDGKGDYSIVIIKKSTLETKLVLIHLMDRQGSMVIVFRYRCDWRLCMGANCVCQVVVSLNPLVFLLSYSWKHRIYTKKGGEGLEQRQRIVMSERPGITLSCIVFLCFVFFSSIFTSHLYAQQCNCAVQDPAHFCVFST